MTFIRSLAGGGFVEFDATVPPLNIKLYRLGLLVGSVPPNVG